MLFVGLLAFLFLILLRPQDFISFLLDTPLVFGLMSVLLAGWILSGPSPKKLIRCPQDKYVLLFFAAVILSTISARWLTYSVETANDTLKLALIYFFIVSIVDSSLEKFKTITWTLVVLLAVVASFGIAQFYGYDITGSKLVWAPDKQVWQIRGIGNFDNPNDLAYSVVLIVPFAIGLFFTSKRILGKLAGIVLLAIAVYCIYLTRSRGGQLALAFCLLTWFYLWIESKAIRKLMLFAVAGLFLMVLVNLNEGFRTDASSMGRVEAWAAGMDMLKEHPIIGVGKGQFIEFHERDSHSSYVRAGAELGFLGLYAFLGMLLYSSKTLLAISRIQANKELKLYYSSYFAFLCAYIIGSLFSSRTYDIVFLVIVALISIMRRITIDMGHEKAFPKNEGLLSGKVLIYCLVAFVIWKFFLVMAW